MIKKSLIIILNEIALFLFKTPVHHPRFWQDEKEKRKYFPNIGFFKRWKTIISGFNSDKYILYDLKNNDRKMFLNDIRRRILGERISKKYYYIVHNKIVFDKYFHGICNTVPKLALIHKGQFIGLNSKTDISDFDSFIQALNQGQQFFLKPNDAGGGS